MAHYLVRRLWQTAVLLVAVTIFVFLLILTTGDPVRALVPIDTAPADVENIRHQYGLDQPIWTQYILFVQHALRGDLGNSFRFSTPAMPFVLERLPLTAILALSSLTFATVVSVPLGILAATHRGSIWDMLATALSVVTVSVPGFWFGIILLLLFAGQLRWLPASGASGPANVVLPALTLSAYPIGLLTRLVRATMLDELKRPYVLTARSKGLAEPTVLSRHALRNALIPIITVLGLQLGSQLGGSVIVETVFAWPGVGWLLIQAITARDLPLVRADVLIVALTFVAINTLTDLSYAYLNPRIRYA
jgi:peptide/nickel transport system permease protein